MKCIQKLLGCFCSDSVISYIIFWFSFSYAPFISLTVLHRWQDYLVKCQVYTMCITAHTLFEIDFASRPSVSSNSSRRCKKNMTSVTRVSLLEEASDKTHVSSSLSSKLLGVFCIDPSM